MKIEKFEVALKKAIDSGDSNLGKNLSSFRFFKKQYTQNIVK